MAAKSAAKGKNLVAPETKETRNGFPDMLILHDPRSAEYGSALRPEQPARVLNAVPYLRQRHPAWVWRVPSAPVPDEILLLAHTAEHLRRLEEPRDFDSDTPYFPEIGAHARRAVGAALEAAGHALTKGTPVFSLMRPPGHHATAGQAMGFCYLNQIAVAALASRRQPGVERVAVWDFDAHHGNGTAAILRPDPAFRYSSVHQHPGYPGTGAGHAGNSRNWPVAPGGSRTEHLDALRHSWDAVLAFHPDLILVSAGFDAYARDPITELGLEVEDFSALGRWIHDSGHPAAALLEGGYSDELPQLLDAFLGGWAAE
jgi:acetoin utilization deacetylase AcuC-like enzyme